MALRATVGRVRPPLQPFGPGFVHRRPRKRRKTEAERLLKSQQKEGRVARGEAIKEAGRARVGKLVTAAVTGGRRLTEAQIKAARGTTGTERETLGQAKTRRIKEQTAAETARQARSRVIRRGRQAQRERILRKRGRPVPRLSVQFEKGGERLELKGGATAAFSAGTRLTPAEAETKRKILEGGARLRTADAPRQEAARRARAQKRARGGRQERFITEAENIRSIEAGAGRIAGTTVPFGPRGAEVVTGQRERRQAGFGPRAAREGAREAVEGTGALRAALAQVTTPATPADQAAAGPTPQPGQQTTTPSFTTPAGGPPPVIPPEITAVQRADIASQLQQTPVIVEEGGLGDVAPADRALVQQVQGELAKIPAGLSLEEQQRQRQAVFARLGPETTARFNQITETIAGRTSAATTGGFQLPLAGGPPVQIPFATDEGAAERRIGDRGLALRAQGLSAEQINQILRTEFQSESAQFPGIAARLSGTGALPGTPAVPGTATTPGAAAQPPIAPTIPFSGAPAFSATQRPEQFAPQPPQGAAAGVIVPAAGPTPGELADIAQTRAVTAGQLIANELAGGQISEQAATAAQTAVQTTFEGDVETGFFGGGGAAITNEAGRVAGVFRAAMIGRNLSAADRTAVTRGIMSSQAWTKLETIIRTNAIPEAVAEAQKIINEVRAFGGGAAPGAAGPIVTPPVSPARQRELNLRKGFLFRGPSGAVAPPGGFVEPPVPGGRPPF